MKLIKRSIKPMCCIQFKKEYAGTLSKCRNGVWTEEEHYSHYYVVFGGSNNPIFAKQPRENIPTPEHDRNLFFEYNDKDFLRIVKERMKTMHHDDEYEFIVMDKFVQE